MTALGRIQPFRPGGTFEAFGRTARHWTVDAVLSKAQRRLSPRETTSGRNRKASPK